jgi:hypothetical protein
LAKFDDIFLWMMATLAGIIKLNKGCVSHCSLAIYIKKCLKAKRRRIMENSNISTCKYIILQNIL